ncbi:unnamed protein product [Schistosoma margrebowiei]|uniref:Uncharacterized protein n=1 Tax=Schistosoma margrebowiei TaxID=48269 RepID=A0A183N6W5_9TREM|nr:unnamed protein product [Schistosoma margrebowiei]
MRRYILTVLGISKTHGTEAGQQRLNAVEMLLYSIHKEENAPHTQAVALILSKETRSFRTKKEGITTNVIQCYAHTNVTNDDNEDQFYKRPQSIIAKCPRNDLTIVMGDLNSKTGMDTTEYVDIMERHRVGEKNEDDEGFSNLCVFDESVIGGTIFLHERIHKDKWVSTDHTTLNHIDHIHINKISRMSMEDVRNRREADIASNNQQLVVVDMKLIPNKHWITKETALQRFNSLLFIF